MMTGTTGKPCASVPSKADMSIPIAFHGAIWRGLPEGRYDRRVEAGAVLDLPGGVRAVADEEVLSIEDARAAIGARERFPAELRWLGHRLRGEVRSWHLGEVNGAAAMLGRLAYDSRASGRDVRWHALLGVEIPMLFGDVVVPILIDPTCWVGPETTEITFATIGPFRLNAPDPFAP
jgi:hypothetical protein